MRSTTLALLALLFVSRTHGAQARSLDTAAAVTAFQEFGDACARDDGATWGRSLCGRLIFTDLATRTIVANQRDGLGRLQPWRSAFIGPYTDSIGSANTSIRWDGDVWATVRLPLPSEAFDRLSLVAHESFHRIQASMGLSSVDRTNAHLDERDGRYWLRLELRALAAAIVASDADVRGHARDAVLFRGERHRLFPGADSLERSLEIQEGLAEYTGERVARLATGVGPERVARRLAEWQATPSYTRSFAYATGPGLGFVLDRVDPAWRTKISQRRDVAALLADAVGRPSDPVHASAVERAAAYGASEVAAAEDARERDRQARLSQLMKRLVDGPHLVARQTGLGRSFNPNNLVALPGQGTVYPTGAFRAAWGQLSVDSVGVLVAPDFTWIHLEAPRDTAARPLRGHGWTLELAPGWQLRPGDRPGDLQLVQATRTPASP